MNSLTHEQRREILRLCKTGSDSVRYSLQRADQQTVRRTWEIAGLFSEFLFALLPSTDGFQRISAFGIYYYECIYVLRRALIESLSWYYGIGHSLLRTGLEVLIRGAFWECMAHRTFRDSANVVRRGSGVNIQGRNRTALDWLADVFASSPGFEDQLDQRSAAIFDHTSAVFSERSLSRVQPPLRNMIEQLGNWGVLRPIENPVASLYQFLYWELSGDAHLIPDKTLLGRRFGAGEPAFPAVVFSAEEFESFAEAMSCVVDTGLVLAVNLRSQIVPDLEDAPEKLAHIERQVRRLLPKLHAAELATTTGFGSIRENAPTRC